MDIDTEYTFKAGDRVVVDAVHGWEELRGQTVTIDHVDDEGYLVIVTDAVPPFERIFLHPNLVELLPPADFDVVDLVRADLSELGSDQYIDRKPLPFCPSYLYAGIRHLQRNCEIECSEHPDNDDGTFDPDACGQPGRWDGDTMARLINAVPDLVARIDWLEARLALHGLDACDCAEQDA